MREAREHNGVTPTGGLGGGCTTAHPANQTKISGLEEEEEEDAFITHTLCECCLCVCVFYHCIAVVV